ncbi:MAG: Phytanoyl-CoA dioxygenase (PhyH) [Acidimicrobiales bacterium]|nr:Phytanoyl-CoA dioxygenase (PhyH) [Acidimicrobiales bacterium]
MRPVTAEQRGAVWGGADEAAVAHFAEHGWLLTETLDVDGLADLRAWVDDVAAWPDADAGWLHYRELTDDGPKLCRSENLIPFHDGLRTLLTSGAMVAVASALLGEPAVLYKEKINYKLPGGAGYAPHQDAPAYRFVETHVSCMVAIDDATVANGCLEVASGCHQELLAVDDAGCIAPAVAESLSWASVEVRAGQTLWFHSRTPHRSGPNSSTRARRALYPTYNARSEGDLRDDYYRQKLAEFAAGTGAGDRVQVSLIGDFQGRAVT